MKNLYCHLLLAVFVGSLIMPPGVNGVTTDYNITVGVGEEYNDNVNEVANKNKKPDWNTTVSASGGVTVDAGRIWANGSVDGSYNFYALGNRTDEFKGGAKAKVSVILMQDFLFLEGEENYRQVYRSLTRGETNPTDSTRDMVNQNNITARIYMTPRLGERTTFRVGVEYGTVIYNTAGETNRQTYMLFAESAYELTPTLRLTMDLQAQHLDNGNYWTQSYVPNAGIIWNYSPNGYLIFRAGPRFTRYDNGTTAVNPYGNGTLSYTIGRTNFSANLTSEYTDNPSTRYPTLKSTAGASVGFQFDRGSVQARASYSYLSGEDTLNTQQVSLGLSGSYELTPRLSARAGLSRESSLDSGFGDARWYIDGSLSYDIGRNFSVEGYYKWKLSNITRGTGDSYQVNIVGLRLRKTF